jgi:hypothetical protein
MAYPRPKQVRHKPSTEINPSIVNIHSALLSQIPASFFSHLPTRQNRVKNRSLFELITPGLSMIFQYFPRFD